MRKQYTLICLLAIGFLSVAGVQFSSQFPTRRTKAPGESSCGGCHAGNVNTGAGGNILGLPANYAPDSVYTLSFTLNDNNFPNGKNGFTITALNGSNQQAGSFFATNTNNTAVQTDVVGGDPREYIGHRNASTNSTWSFEWKAPATNTGDIIFYIVGNAANGNGSTSGDFIYESMDTLVYNTNFPQAAFTPSKGQACPNEPITFVSNSTGLITTYLWEFGTGATPATSNQANPPAVSYSSGGSKSVRLTVTGPDGRRSTSQVIQINDLSLAPLTDNSICAGDNFTPIPNPQNGVQPYTYRWRSDSAAIAGISDSTVASPLITPTTMNPTTIPYTLVLTDAQGCAPIVRSFNMTVNALPKVEVSQDLVICPDQVPVTLRSSISPDNQASLPFIYLWDDPNNTTDDSLVVSPASTTTYTLNVVSAEGCENLPDSLTDVTVTVLESPVPAITLSGDSLKTDITGVAYEWFAKDQGEPAFTSISTASGILPDSLLAGSFSGEIEVVVTYANGCSNRSQPFPLTLTSLPIAAASVKVYPNPTSRILWINSPQSGTALLTDMQGKRQWTQPVLPGEQQLEMRNVNKGVYLLTLELGEQVLLKRIIVQ